MTGLKGGDVSATVKWDDLAEAPFPSDTLWESTVMALSAGVQVEPRHSTRPGKWMAVGFVEGREVGGVVGGEEGEAEGRSDGLGVGTCVGAFEG